jgi:hypothetical protein
LRREGKEEERRKVRRSGGEEERRRGIEEERRRGIEFSVQLHSTTAESNNRLGRRRYEWQHPRKCTSPKSVHRHGGERGK